MSCSDRGKLDSQVKQGLASFWCNSQPPTTTALSALPDLQNKGWKIIMSLHSPDIANLMIFLAIKSVLRLAAEWTQIGSVVFSGARHSFIYN